MPAPPLQQFMKGANKAKTPPGKRAKAVPPGIDPNLNNSRMGMLRKKVKKGQMTKSGEGAGNING